MDKNNEFKYFSYHLFPIQKELGIARALIWTPFGFFLE